MFDRQSRQRPCPTAATAPPRSTACRCICRPVAPPGGKAACAGSGAARRARRAWQVSGVIRSGMRPVAGLAMPWRRRAGCLHRAREAHLRCAVWAGWSRKAVRLPAVGCWRSWRGCGWRTRGCCGCWSCRRGRRLRRVRRRRASSRRRRGRCMRVRRLEWRSRSSGRCSRRGPTCTRCGGRTPGRGRRVGCRRCAAGGARVCRMLDQSTVDRTAGVARRHRAIRRHASTNPTSLTVAADHPTIALEYRSTAKAT
ncbi:MAG: hypothetical protein V7637_4597 [Mycobacteriales bacterium]